MHWLGTAPPPQRLLVGSPSAAGLLLSIVDQLRPVSGQHPRPRRWDRTGPPDMAGTGRRDRPWGTENGLPERLLPPDPDLIASSAEDGRRLCTGRSLDPRRAKSCWAAGTPNRSAGIGTWLANRPASGSPAAFAPSALSTTVTRVIPATTTLLTLAPWCAADGPVMFSLSSAANVGSPSPLTPAEPSHRNTEAPGYGAGWCGSTATMAAFALCCPRV